VDFYRRAVAAEERGELDEALTNYCRTIELAPKYANAYIGLANIKLRNGDELGAASNYDRAIMLDPMSDLAWCNRGVLKRQRGDTGGAVADCLEAVRLNPKRLKAQELLLAFEKKRRDWNAVESRCSRILGITPTNAAIYDQRAFARENKEDWDGALADYNQAVRLKPRSAWELESRGSFKLRRENFDGALDDFARAIEVEPTPTDVPARYELACARVAKGDFAGGLEGFDRLIAQDPGFADFYEMRGHIRELAGDLRGALLDFRRALDLLVSTNFDTVSFGIWWARDQLGETSAARQELIEYAARYAVKTNSGWNSRQTQLARFVAGQVSESDLEAGMKTESDAHGFEKSMISYFKGLKRLSEGDNVAAAVEFRRCVVADVFQVPWACFAHARLRRLAKAPQ
jgi:tetratricopeptide (TPR) repeat protein